MSERPDESPTTERLPVVDRLCRRARQLAGEGGKSAALEAYLEAWDLLPEPKESYEASTLILSAVGDLLREGGDLANALEALLRVKGRTAGCAAAEP